MPLSRFSGIMSAVPDLAFVVGLGMVGVGCWWFSPALGLIVPGAVLLALVLVGRLSRRPPERRLLK